MMIQQNDIINEFKAFLGENDFPCVAARDALHKNNIQMMPAENIACPADDGAILDFLYSFATRYRNAASDFHSAAVIFKGPLNADEDTFEKMMWQRLSSIRKMDGLKYPYDSRVNDDPDSPDFSFSIMEEAFFVLAMHPQSSRPARRFSYPVLVFNPHAQFEKMKETNSYEKMKVIVRKRDLAFAGSVNPMLTDFGEVSEAAQYSGKLHDSNWKCPLNFKEL
jgi:FPC/CPF motif-containing protein YcgG